MVREKTSQDFSGYDYPDMMMPKAWLKRMPPENVIPDGIWLPDYFNIKGKGLFPNIWNGNELYARSPEEIAEDHKNLSFWKTRERAVEVTSFLTQNSSENENPRSLDYPIGFTGSHQVGGHFEDEKDEGEAFSRKQNVIKVIVDKILNQGIHPFQIGEHGDKAEIREEWWRKRGIRFVFEYGYPHGHPTHGIYISKETPKREEIRPNGITCPEGVWIREAILLLNEKLFDEEARQQKVGEAIRLLIEFLVTNPDIEVFTISSYGGKKEPLDPDYLRGRQPTKDFIRGFIPYSDGFHTSKEDGRFLFVNREHFDNYLADKPIDGTLSNNEEMQDIDSYIPAYLELMLKAVKSLNLSPDKRANMDDIINWLNENWPSNMEGKSDVLVKYMATLIRRPEDKKGGNTSWNKQK